MKNTQEKLLSIKLKRESSRHRNVAHVAWVNLWIGIVVLLLANEVHKISKSTMDSLRIAGEKH